MRQNYYVFLALSGISLIGLAVIGPFYLGVFIFPAWAVSAAAVAIASTWFSCVYCGHALVRPKMTVGTMELSGYTTFPGRKCTNCGQDVSGDKA